MRTGLTIAALSVAVALAACSRTLDPPTPGGTGAGDACDDHERCEHAAVQRPAGLRRERRRGGTGEHDL